MRIADIACWSPSSAPVDHAAGLPPNGAVRVPGFDIAAEVGPKGIRSMDRATAFAVAAAGRLLEGTGADPARTGVVLATTAGSFKTMMAFQSDSLTKPKPYLVDPGRFPVAVMNYAAGQVAIRHQITGPNATVRGGATALAQALRYAWRLLAAGRVDQVLCGATEEATAERAWLEHAARPAHAAALPIGEGCVMLRLEPGRSGPHIAAITSCLTETTPAAALETALRRALDDARLTPADIAVTAGHGEAETEALQAVLGPNGPRPIDVRARTGDTSAVTLGFALAAVLDSAVHNNAVHNSADSGTAFALTGIDRTGLACCIVGRT